MPYAKVNNINMYYEIHGDGEPLVLISGLGASAVVWEPIIPIFSRDYKVIVFDNRGVGRTDAPVMTYSMEMMADDISGLLEKIGIKQAIIYGTSMGGAVAQFFAIRHPQKVIKLILQSTSCLGSHAVMASDEVLEYLENQAKTAVRDESPLPGVTPEFADNNPEIVKELRERMQRYPAPGMQRQLQASINSTGTYDSLPEISAPTLIIHGEADLLWPVENAQVLASRIPNAQVVIYKKTGHQIVESMNEKNKLVLDFLKKP